MNTRAKNGHVLVLGGYGTFGSRIVRALCDKGYLVTINGRHFHQAEALKNNIMQDNIHAKIKVSCFDVNQQLGVHLNKLSPDLVIHTCGPFQDQQTHIVELVLNAGAHYIDLADSRDYVQHMMAFDDLAKTKNLTAITAASTVPALSSAVLTHLQQQFQIQSFTQVKIGISPGQRTPRGLATTEAVLSYIGKPMKPWPSVKGKKYGWGDTYLQSYPSIKNRLMSNCEAPDLDLLPDYYDIEKLRFAAGMESKLLHRCISFLAWLIKMGLPIEPKKRAAGLLRASRWFDRFGTTDGGMHVAMKALNVTGEQIEKTWFIEAFGNHGPQIPAIPAIIMADKILSLGCQSGMMPCVNLITLEAFLNELEAFDIHTTIHG